MGGEARGGAAVNSTECGSHGQRERRLGVKMQTAGSAPARAQGAALRPGTEYHCCCPVPSREVAFNWQSHREQSNQRGQHPGVSAREEL